jgi:beta-alanine degradation protein BauB
MKRALLLAASLLAPAAGFSADTLCQVVPRNCRILAEDDQVRVFEFTSKKGEKIPMHSHPKYIVYELGQGRTMWSYPDGTTRDSGSVAAQGEAFIQEPTTHAQETLEDEHVIIVEIKR